MFSFFSKYFTSAPSTPATFGAFLLFPNEELLSTKVVVGFAKDAQEFDTSVYLEYGIGENKYFMIYKESSRQIRRPDHLDFADTPAEFNALLRSASHHNIYILDCEQASRLFQKLENIFWNNQQYNYFERSTAYANAIDSLAIEPAIRSINHTQIAEAIANARYGRTPQRAEENVANLSHNSMSLRKRN